MAAFKITFLLVLVEAVSLASASGGFNCTAKNGNDEVITYPAEVCYDVECTNRIVTHIKQELNAAFQYMYLAAYFDQDKINKPGMAKFLYESASEERQHAILMLNYLNTRGIYYDEVYKFNELKTLKDFKDINVMSALEDALRIEIKVTMMIHNIISKCKKDYHAADVFTHPILDEQHEGIRKLQGAIKTLTNMKPVTETDANKELSEYLFDQKLLKEGI